MQMRGIGGIGGIGENADEAKMRNRQRCENADEAKMQEVDMRIVE
jgi:hypothetical protein